MTRTGSDDYPSRKPRLMRDFDRFADVAPEMSYLEEPAYPAFRQRTSLIVRS
jgi:hypothetical protein